MDLSKVEESEGRFEALWIKASKITIVALLVPIAYGLSFLILALREEYVYKKSLKNH